MRRAPINRSLKALAWWLPGLICASIATAQLATPADTIKERQKEFKATGAAFKAAKDTVQSGAPDPDKIRTAAAQFQQTASELSSWFPVGSGAEAGVKTAARSDIWSDSDGFKHARDQFADQARKFSALAAAGTVDEDALKALGGTCGGCHDKYRVKQE